MSSPTWFVNIVKKSFPQRFILARMTRLPLIGRGIEYLFFEGDDMVFLPKDNVIAVNEQVEPENVVLPSQVIESFVAKANYLWVMNACICRDASKCSDYPIDLGCLFMGEAVLDINPELGRLVSREEALEHVRKCREAGLMQLIGRNKLDPMWLNVRPGTKLLTVCFCCPCCCLWKVLPVLSHKISDKIQRMPGVRVTVTERCTACGTCQNDVCIPRAISLEGNRAVISDECRGCGNCVSVCPEGAIELTVEDPSFLDGLVPRITSLVDVT
ncbi:MAG: 4Fe-4S binding protein [Actinomycetota bacterium]|nr:4Fe-4S binding protein [Actinomycetota bacterium]MDD5668180.1 4Fe-4S binding protein [Actinomycetota bacterium]